MNAHCCCGENGSRPSPGPQKRPTLWRRCINAIRWMVPGAMLILIPKCPMCLAAYVALGTGIGLSVSTARYLRIALIVLCAVVRERLKYGASRLMAI